jgi:hypothetical protein
VAGAGLVLAGRSVGLRTRVLVAGIVPAPRFGREGEVLATAAAVRDAGADLVDVSLPPRLLGPAARSGIAPVAVRAGSAAEVEAARRAGAAVVLVGAELAEVLAEELGDGPGATAVIAGDLAALAAARDVAERLGLPLALDAGAWTGPEAVGREAAAVALGCRLIRTADVRRSRRVAEVMGAILAAREGT